MACRLLQRGLAAHRLKGRYGVCWMLGAWLGLAMLLVLCVWASRWITDIIT